MRTVLVFNFSGLSQSMDYFNKSGVNGKTQFDIFFASVRYMATQNRHGYELVLYGCRLSYV